MIKAPKFLAFTAWNVEDATIILLHATEPQGQDLVSYVNAQTQNHSIRAKQPTIRQKNDRYQLGDCLSCDGSRCSKHVRQFETDAGRRQ